MTMDKLLQARKRRRLRIKALAFILFLWFATTYTMGHVLAAKLLGRF
ncbi:MAG: hypothetical protein P4N41_17970 [Negativicutes bacterium]|nr:hypothetical protein [Negativicutes bacterium]